MTNKLPLYFLGLSLVAIILVGAGCQVLGPRSSRSETPNQNNTTTTTNVKTSNQPLVLPNTNSEVPSQECNQNSDCPRGSACNTSVGWCLKESESVQVCGSGAKTWPCRETQWCGLTFQECRNAPFCQTTIDCGRDKVCINGYCGPVPANTVTKPIPPTDIQTDRAVSCTSNSQCPEKGTYCSDGKCIAGSVPSTISDCVIGSSQWSCNINEQCGEKINECLPEGGNCVYNSDCNSTEFCNHGTCAMKYQTPTTKRCVTYKDCGEVEEWVCANTYCAHALPGTKRCENNSTVWSCTNDNYVCGNSVYECLKTCVENSDCPSGWSCQSGVCSL